MRPSPSRNKNISRNFPRNISLPLCLSAKAVGFFLSFPILSNHPTFCNAVGAGNFLFPCLCLPALTNPFGYTIIRTKGGTGMEQNILKNAALKSTKKRQVLLLLLQKQARPMTAEELHALAEPILPMNVSTVYRTLNTLTEKKILIRSVRQDGKAYYALAKKTIRIVWSATFAARSSLWIPARSVN